jgi:hypothetical protein
VLMANSYSILYGLSAIVSLLCEIAILTTVVLVIRKARPNATSVLWWAIGSFAVTLFFLIAGPVVTSMAARQSSVQGAMKAQAILLALRIPVGVGLTALLIHGLVQLAKRPTE